MNHELADYSKKSQLLQQILANYQKERSVVAHKDARGFREVLKERTSLIDALNAIGPLSPTTPFALAQQIHLEQIVAKIQEERGKLRKFFPD